MAQEDPKTAQEPPKTAPDSPKEPQEGPRWPQDGPRHPKMAPKTAPRAQKMPSRGSKSLPRGLLGASRNPKPFKNLRKSDSICLLTFSLSTGRWGLQVAPERPQENLGRPQKAPRKKP